MCWILSADFSRYFEIIFIIYCVNVVNYTYWFQRLNKSCISGVYNTGHEVFYLCAARFNWLILLGGFGVNIHNRYWFVIFFCCNAFVRFWYQGYDHLIKRVGKDPPLSFLKEFVKCFYYFFHKYLIEFAGIRLFCLASNALLGFLPIYLYFIITIIHTPRYLTVSIQLKSVFLY